MSRAVGTSNIPEDILASSSLPDADYADVFTFPTDSTATPERWARAMFGDVPDAAERFIWRGLLGMRLRRGRSPDTVAGWLIAGREEQWIRLEACSWFLSGNLVVRATGADVSLATFVRYDRSLGRLVWPPLSGIHRRLAPGVLRDAAARVRSDAAPSSSARSAAGPA